MIGGKNTSNKRIHIVFNNTYIFIYSYRRTSLGIVLPNIRTLLDGGMEILNT